MCGIAGLFSKSAQIEEQLGAHLSAMLSQLADRGPDSAGVALYRDPAPAGSCKVSLFSPRRAAAVARAGRRVGESSSAGRPSRRCARRTRSSSSPAARPRSQAWLTERHPELRVMSVGERIEIYKEAVDPREFVERFRLGDVAATHALGHTRMATESRVTTEHSHPFSTGLDLCLVHNGSLSNHNRLRMLLRRQGIKFQTDNDTEVAAGYLTWRLSEGDDIEQALRGCLDDLDGFYTFAVGTADGFAVLRDPIACKPAVLAESDDWVAMASEYRAIAVAPGGRRRGALGARARARLLMGAGEGRRERDGVAVAPVDVDLATTSVRELNQRLHDLEPGAAGRWRVTNPNGAHAIAVGLDAELEVEIEGHVGYYCAGMNKLATVRVAGNCGVGVAENIMSGAVIVEGDASQSAGATGRGGLLVIKGSASARCGISMKGVDIVVHGSIGHVGAFMAQRGTLVVCGDAGDDLGDSIYEARVYVRGEVASLGADCIEKEMGDEHRAELGELLRRARGGRRPGDFRRYGSARRLYNFHVDNAGGY